MDLSFARFLKTKSSSATNMNGYNPKKKIVGKIFWNAKIINDLGKLVGVPFVRAIHGKAIAATRKES